jgi:hypothetical protein
VTPWWRLLELHVINLAVIDKEFVLEAGIVICRRDSPTGRHSCSRDLEIPKNTNL